MNKFLLTQEGFKKLTIELKELVEKERPAIIKEIQLAREQGDLSENADYEASKSRQVIIESRIKELQNILSHYELIDDINQQASATTNDKKENVVRVGSKVKILDYTDNKKYDYEIVGSIDTDPSKNKISNVSPLATSIMSKKANEEIEVRGIEKPYKVKIIEIK